MPADPHQHISTSHDAFPPPMMCFHPHPWVLTPRDSPWSSMMANASPMKLHNGQKRPTKANNSQQRPTKANDSQWQPTKANSVWEHMFWPLTTSQATHLDLQLHILLFQLRCVWAFVHTFLVFLFWECMNVLAGTFVCIYQVDRLLKGKWCQSWQSCVGGRSW